MKKSELIAIIRECINEVGMSKRPPRTPEIKDGGWKRNKDEEFASGSESVISHKQHGHIHKTKSGKFEHIPYFNKDGKRSTHPNIDAAKAHAMKKVKPKV